MIVIKNSSLPFYALLLCFLVSTAAHSEDWPYVRVTCDQRSARLTIEELSAESRELIPNEKGVHSLIALTDIRTMNGPTGVQDYRVRKSNVESTCNIGTSHYRLQVSPWKFSAKINGMCGDYSPSTELTVWREGQKLLDKLVFAGFCDPPDSEFAIESVSFDEAARTARVSIRGLRATVQKSLPFSDLIKIERRRLIP